MHVLDRPFHLFLFRPTTDYKTRAYDPLLCILTKVKLKVKVKCTLVQALRLCIGRTAHRRSRGIALPFHDHSTITLILRRSRTGTVWFYTPTSNKRAARPKLYTKSLTRDLKRMYSRLALVRISINL